MTLILSWVILDNSLNLSILLSERKEIKRDILSNGERKGYSSNLNPLSNINGVVSFIYSNKEKE